ncbi:MAG: PadR family transcriptional regulator [Desulfotomaculales bacterium]
MPKKNRRGQAYRYAPAFVLLFLARESLYGAALFNKMQKEVPFCHADSAVIYRTLQDLEEEGAVQSRWETDVSGPARKWYRITARGLEKLVEYRKEIEMRRKNFDFFLEAYEKYVKKEQNGQKNLRRE